MDLIREEVKNFLDYYLVIKEHPTINGIGWIFRGQSNYEWDLIPKAGRKEYFIDDEKDIYTFNNWRQKAIAYSDLPLKNSEALAIAQHYGLATRLLDWTYNPLVALYFAVENNFHTPGTVFLYKPPQYLGINDDIDFTNNEYSGYAYIPRSLDKRIINQCGLFTYHSKPNIPLSPKPQDKESPTLIAIDIPPEIKHQLLMDLDTFGINQLFLFPDLGGLSNYMNYIIENYKYLFKK